MFVPVSIAYHAPSTHVSRADVLYERLVLGKPQRKLPRETQQPLSKMNDLLPDNSNAQGVHHSSKWE